MEYKIKLLLLLYIAPSTKLDSKDEKNVSNGEICQLLHEYRHKVINDISSL